MSDKEKLELLEKLILGSIDWMESYRQTFSVRDGIGLPSGLTGSETETAMARRILKGEPVVIVERT